MSDDLEAEARLHGLDDVPAAILARVPPHDEDAEAALLGSILLDASVMPKVTAIVAADDFYLTKNRRVYEAALAIHHRGEPPDPLLVVRELAHHVDGVDGAGGKARLLELPTVVPTAANAEHYARLVKECALKREIIRLASFEQRDAYNGVSGDEALDQRRRSTERLLRDYGDTGKPWGWVNSSDLIQAPDDVVEFLGWPEIVAKGSTTLLTGSAKGGKSFLEYAYFGAVSRGESFLGFPAIGRPVRTVILSEEGRAHIQSRCRRFGVLDAMILPRGAAPLGTRWVTLVERAVDVARRHKAEILCVDTISSLAGFADDDENSSSAVISVLDPLLHYAAAENLAVVVAHHTARAGNVRGSTAFEQAPAVLVTIDADTDDPASKKRVLRYKGRFEAPVLPQVVEYVPAGQDGQEWGSFRLLGDAHLAKSRADDLKCLAVFTPEAGWISEPEFLAAVKPLRKATAEVRLRDLVTRKAIQRVGKGLPKSPFLYAALGVPLHRQAEAGTNTPPAIPPVDLPPDSGRDLIET